MLKKSRKHIELFAGCGGMAIGMETAGFSLLFANEVSPMASDTFAHNLLGIDISKPNKKVQWIHSRYSIDEYEKRLRENLLSHDIEENCELEFKSDLSDLNGSLLVGDVRHLRNKFIKHKIKNPYNGNLDLVSGGPPCQSFSLAGKRQLNNYKNRLPLDFAEICETIQPKVVLLENVKGILSAFKQGDSKFYAWFEVAKAFALKGFAPVCMLLNSKYFGVAQNRPRYIMLAFRADVFNKMMDNFPNNEVLLKVSTFFKKVHSDFENLNLKDLDYYDIEKNNELFDGIILPKPTTFEKKKWISVQESIDDLSLKGVQEKSKYVKDINDLFETDLFTHKDLHNHNHRNHTEKIKNRFLFYQTLNYANGLRDSIFRKKKGDLHITEEEIKKLYTSLQSSVKEFNKIFESQIIFEKFFKSVSLSKKHSQRALIQALPSPAQLTIPDDICHYSLFESRVLTVREMARIQSFPDWFIFKGKETTGGNNRRFEVPQYTQVGNAVPPKLALSLGRHISLLLTKIENNG
ncbi:DNA cytosine methyltransferase [Algoriphagus aquimarinus]|uniref:Cytosine-specific methyltransferase n=1 Tax=Algoriphagus aquimarinus TaxID=237018 RepID=A0A5C7ARW0_9BACT|nr:DNA cytosine methyltransferase [Algoriphagus aquimarinus]TXE11400.1 DNA cytosine methyltransferase [Algoriphagus aquimarinus]